MSRRKPLRYSFAALLAYLLVATVVLPGGPMVAAPARAGAYDYLLAPTTKCGGSGQTNTSLSNGDQEKVMHCLHNWARQRAGRRPLAASSLLYNSADAKTGDMFRCQEFSHTACGRYMRYHFDRVGYTSGGCWGWGENIAWGLGPGGSPRAIMRSWLNSSPHRTNILNSAFRDLGVGVRKGTFLGHPGAEVWTAHLGYRC